MTVRIELTPEVAANLAAQAEARGLSLEEYVQRLVEDKVPVASERPQSPERIEAMLDKLAEMGKDLPRLPSSAFSRESIYQDHD
jgi:hypothetical protein